MKAKCTQCSQVIPINSVKLVFIDGKMKPKDDIFCDICGSECEVLSEVGVPEIAKFSSLSDEQKRKFIKDRAKKHYHKSADQVQHANEQMKNDLMRKFYGTEDK
jgi:transcription elongation factor Elf1